MSLAIDYIKEEYRLLEVDSNMCTKSQDVINKISSDILDLEEDKIDIIRSIKSNKRHKILEQIRTFFLLDGEDYANIYDSDNDLLEEEFNLAQEYLYYYNQILNVIDFNNYSAALKLCIFTENYYCFNLDFLESERDVLENKCRGISYIDNRTIDTREPFQHFFDWQLAIIFSKGEGEKVKKL